MSNEERGKKRDRKVREAMELLDAGAGKVLDGEACERYLAFAARFHSYSANNTLLIMAQRTGLRLLRGHLARRRGVAFELAPVGVPRLRRFRQ